MKLFNTSKLTQILVPLALAALAGASTHAVAAVDASAAEALFKKEGCAKCHAVDKTKKGPALKKVAADLKGKADGQAKLLKFITTGPKIKVDGADEEHTIISTKDAAAQKNLIDWVLSQ